MTTPSGASAAREPRSLLHVQLDVCAWQRAVLDPPPAPVAAGLLVAEDDHAERALRPTDRADRLEPGEHAQRAVEPAALGHRVEVRARPDLGQLRPLADQPPDHVAPRVALHLEPGLLIHAGDQVAGLVFLGRAADPVRADAVSDAETSSSRAA